MQIVLQHLTGHQAGGNTIIPLRGFLDVSIGRSEAGVVQYDAMSRREGVERYARIIVLVGEPSRFVLVDMSGDSGIYVNGLRVNEAVPIRPGDTIKLGSDGPAVQFRVDAGPATRG